MARPQRTRSPANSSTSADSCSSVTTEAASCRSAVTSPSVQLRGSGPKTHRTPTAAPPSPISGVPRYEPTRPASTGSRWAKRSSAAVSGTTRAGSSPDAATEQMDSSSGAAVPTEPAAAPAAPATYSSSLSRLICADAVPSRRAASSARRSSAGSAPSAARSRRASSTRRSSARSVAAAWAGEPGPPAPAAGGDVGPPAVACDVQSISAPLPGVAGGYACSRGRDCRGSAPLCHAGTTPRNRTGPRSRRDDDVQRGAAGPLHPPAGPAQDRDQPGNAVRLGGGRRQQPGQTPLVRLVEVADHRATAVGPLAEHADRDGPGHRGQRCVGAAAQVDDEGVGGRPGGGEDRPPERAQARQAGQRRPRREPVGGNRIVGGHQPEQGRPDGEPAAGAGPL